MSYSLPEHRNHPVGRTCRLVSTRDMRASLRTGAPRPCRSGHTEHPVAAGPGDIDVADRVTLGAQRGDGRCSGCSTTSEQNRLLMRRWPAPRSANTAATEYRTGSVDRRRARLPRHSSPAGGCRPGRAGRGGPYPAQGRYPAAPRTRRCRRLATVPPWSLSRGTPVPRGSSADAVADEHRRHTPHQAPSAAGVADCRWTDGVYQQSRRAG